MGGDTIIQVALGSFQIEANLIPPILALNPCWVLQGSALSSLICKPSLV